MDTKPTLIIMAAGLGSRFNGLKQIAPVTHKGEIILEYSLYDAMMAGFEDIILIIKEEHEENFRALLDKGPAKRLNIRYAFQDIHDIPGGDEELNALVEKAITEGRIKPWGTGHAVMSAREMVNGPFAVINADDFYGSSAFINMYDFLSKLGEASPDSKDSEKKHFSMIGYKLSNTLSETGSVSRGICNVSSDSMLLDITERTKIMRQPSGEIAFTEDDGQTWNELSEDTLVSMNFWGFTRSMMDSLTEYFPKTLLKILKENPQKGEYYLPGAVDMLLRADLADVKVIPCFDQWYGVTYPEDKDNVANALQSMTDKGLYPEKLWK